jgi:signal transduction histidine kinase/ActR/RegA family two-component response regulator
MLPEQPDASDYRVLLLPPTRRDGQVACELLQRAGMTCSVCWDSTMLAEQIEAGVGAIVLTDASAADPSFASVTAAVARQPSWSDVPCILLSRTDQQAAATTRLIATLSNVTVLDRPTSPRTLVSAVRAAIRGRQRQYQIRDQLDALRHAEESLRNADRRKDEFLAMLSHELRNPLAPIRAATELLTRGTPPGHGTRTTVELVNRQVTHLTRLVDDLLDVSRITQGRIHLKRHPLPLSSIIAEAIESAEPLLRERGHVLTQTSYPQPLYVDGDGARLVQCVSNLLTNAAKYTDACGKIHVELRCEQDSAVLSVSDNGIGISEELLPRIFDLFVQSDRSLDRAQGGLGIGLSIVKKLVRMHGGHVRAASAGPGKGATFEIRLPRVPAPEERAQVRAHSTISPKRILIVDDNSDAANSLSELLRLDGHETAAVYSARTAIDHAESFNPDVVLLDIGLPEMDGYQVAQQIRRAGNGIRIIALTGYGRTEDRLRASAVGFDAYMVKPVDFDALERVIAADPEIQSLG